jgi:transcription elongation factor GreA
MSRIPMTPEGYEQAKKQLDHLKYVELPRVQKALQEARELGDLSENAEYDAARNELWSLDQRIADMESKVSLAEVIDAKTLNLDTIAIGAMVKIEDLKTRRSDEFLLVGEGEVRDNVDTVSVTSPLGSALIGKKVGEQTEVQAPRGLVKYKVVSFKY